MRFRTVMWFAAAFAFGANPVEKVRNHRVVAAETTLNPGEGETVSEKVPALAVYLTDGTLQVSAAKGAAQTVTVRRGAVRMLTPGAKLRNTGGGRLQSVRIDFRGPGTSETWGTRGLSPHYKMLLENRYARVYDIRIGAHKVEPRHAHEDRVVICLSGAYLKHLLPDGRDEPSTLKTGEVLWRRGGTHTGRNLGDTDLWVIAVEPK